MTDSAFPKFFGRHFVTLHWTLRQGKLEARDYASCFVVDIGAGFWLLITAGHIVRGIREKVRAGWTVGGVRIADSFAGVAIGDTLPFTFDLDEWLEYEDDKTGIDFAALPLRPMFRDGLASSGIAAIPRNCVDVAEFSEYETVLMVGAPAEHVHIRAGPHGTVNLAAIPVTRAEPTAEMPAKEPSLLGQLPSNPDDPKHRVESAVGMSGCPVFGIRVLSAGAKYWAIGVQGSWHRPSRMIRFSPLLPLFDALATTMARRRDGD